MDILDMYELELETRGIANYMARYDEGGGYIWRMIDASVPASTHQRRWQISVM